MLHFNLGKFPGIYRIHQLINNVVHRLNQEMKVDHCEMKEKPVSCSSGYYGVENLPQSYKKAADHILLPESNPHWRLPIGIYQRSSYMFRILARDVIADSVCFCLC